MGDGEAHVASGRLQLEGEIGDLAPAEAKQARGLELGDHVLHPVLGIRTFGPGFLVAGELVIAPDEIHAATDAQLHLTRGEPAPAQVADREPGAGALDRAGQDALNAHCNGLGNGGIAGEGFGLGHQVGEGAVERECQPNG
jgi:hypothetical protein